MTEKSRTTSFIDLFAQFGRDLKLPAMDIDAMLESHRRNLEALQQAASASAAGASTLLSRQKAMVEEAMAEMTATAEKLRASGTPQELVQRQTEFARKSFDAALRGVDETASIARQSGEEALAILRKRLEDAAAELRDQIEPRK